MGCEKGKICLLSNIHQELWENYEEVACISPMANCKDES